jgi:Flp pilus assembly pilin Flp
MTALLHRLARDTRGFSAAEFGLILPILLLFCVGTIEFSRLILITQKVQSGAFTLADLTARYKDEDMSADRLADIFLALDNVVQPFEIETGGRAIVSSIGVGSDDDPVVNWQCGGAGALEAVSQIGAAGGDALLPDDLTIAEGETIIAAEVFFSYQPLLDIGLDARVIRRAAFFKPRLGDLTTLTCP